MTAKVPQAQCDHILGLRGGALIRESLCLPPNGSLRTHALLPISFPHCPACGCLNVSETIVDELWRRHYESPNRER